MRYVNTSASKLQAPIFLDFSNIRLGPDECPEDLFQRLMAFVEDSLIHVNGLSHHLENFVVLNWLKLIHPDLPKLVKQSHKTVLGSRTLVSFKPEISHALSSLLDEILG